METEPQASGWSQWIFRRAPHSYAILFWLLSLWIFRAPLTRLARLSFQDELAAHVLVIPLLSAVLLYLERRRIFRRPLRYSPGIGIPLLIAAAFLWGGVHSSLVPLNAADRLSTEAALVAFVWIAGFVLFYGAIAFRTALFPLLFLFLMAPLPPGVVHSLTSVLQRGSADFCYVLFGIIEVPVIRHGFLFSLPGADIEVAEQCSGIHAGISLLIAGLLAEHLLLRKVWQKTLFVLCIFPIVIVKNAIRIVVIAWLGIHMSPDFFYGNLHRRGGVPFSFLGLAMMAVLIWLLKRPSAAAAGEAKQVNLKLTA